MSMPLTVVPGEDERFDPDDLKMPESPDHRQVVDAIGLAAAAQLGPSYQLFRDMNWYPPDGGNAMAPDIMVLPAGAFVPPPGADPDDRLKSYRQDKTGGPPPIVVAEVPSESDGYVHLRAKASRCCALGAVVYIVLFDPPRLIERFTPDDPHPRDWNDQPIPELGDIRLAFVDDRLTVITPDGLRFSSDSDLVEELNDPDRRG